jgi:hypothetical protein
VTEAKKSFRLAIHTRSYFILALCDDVLVSSAATPTKTKTGAYLPREFSAGFGDPPGEPQDQGRSSASANWIAGSSSGGMFLFQHAVSCLQGSTINGWPLLTEWITEMTRNVGETEIISLGNMAFQASACSLRSRY